MRDIVHSLRDFPESSAGDDEFRDIQRDCVSISHHAATGVQRVGVFRISGADWQFAAGDPGIQLLFIEAAVNRDKNIWHDPFASIYTIPATCNEYFSITYFI